VPLYHFKCSGCGEIMRRLWDVKRFEDREPWFCGGCGGEVVYDPRPPTSRTTEVLDNGVMVRQVERLVDAPQLFRDRNAATEQGRRDFPVIGRHGTDSSEET
jgi:DNA-directed RNA polymerase subunit RPC12/RpoP